MHFGRYNTRKKIRSARQLWVSAAVCLLVSLAWPVTSHARVDTVSDSPWFIRMDQFTAGAHGALACSECHPSMAKSETPHPDEKSASFLKADIKRTYDYQNCSKCHKTAHNRVREGAHAKALEKQISENKISETGFAPSCGDCHSAHYVRAHQSRVTVGKSTTQSCGSCHPDQVKSYLENYHGKAAVNLEYDKAAFCTDCHGAHTTKSLKEKDEILTACRRCHTDAKDAFADIIIHDSTANLDQKSETKLSALKRVHILGLLSLIFVTVLLVLFYSHTGLLMLRKLHETLRRYK